MKSVCPKCNGTKHVQINGKWRRCDCYYLEQANTRLEQYSLSTSGIEHLLKDGVWHFSQDSNGAYASKFTEIVDEHRSSKKLVAVDLSRSIPDYRNFLAQLLLHVQDQDINFIDLSDIISMSFSNQRIQLKPLNIITVRFENSPSIRQKYIRDLETTSKVENKLIIWVFPNLTQFRSENKELTMLLNSQSILTLPTLNNVR